MSMQGPFMYADYSPLEDDRNLVEVIREFVAVASKLGRLELNNTKLALLASDSDRLRQDIITAIKHIKKDTTFTMEKFHDEHADLLSNELLTKGSALLMDTKNSLSELLASTETGFDEQHTKYREKITSKINENNANASGLIQEWLANDYRNLPRSVRSRLSLSLSASLDKKTGKNYEIMRSAASAITEARSEQGGPDALQFSYDFRIDPTELEFWNYRRTVTDLGIKDLVLPIGMKAPVSEKIKQKFRFGSRKDAEVMKGPEFTKVDGYFLASAVLQGFRNLQIEVARDPSNVQGDVFRISYDVDSLALQNANGATMPKIDYVSMQEGNLLTETDLLQISEIKSASDISKIRLLGSAILTKVKPLQDPQLVASRGRLAELRINKDDVIIPAAIAEGKYGSLFEFLSSIAKSYSPFVRKMLEKTPVKGELTLRQELGEGQRKEYSVRVEELRSQLRDDRGKALAFALGI